MTREELAGLPVNELIDLILEQPTPIEQLQARVVELDPGCKPRRINWRRTAATAASRPPAMA